MRKRGVASKRAREVGRGEERTWEMGGEELGERRGVGREKRSWEREEELGEVRRGVERK